jgi:tyrosine-protein kinase Etk/Wzc
MDKPQRRVQQDDGIDFKRYFFLIIKKWYWLVASVLFALLFARFINGISPRIYNVSCDVIIGDDMNTIESSPQITGSMDFSQVNPINKEIGILHSKNLTEQTIKSLDFKVTYYEILKNYLIKRRRYEKVPFIIQTDSLDKNILGYNIYIKILNDSEVKININGGYDISRTIRLNEKFKADDFSFTVIRNFEIPINEDIMNREYLVYFNTNLNIVNEFNKKLTTTIDPTSQNIITLSLTGENSQQLIDYLQKFCGFYIQNDLDLRNRMANNTINFIDNQLEILNKQLTKAEDSLITFKREHKIFQEVTTPSLTTDFLEFGEDIKTLQLHNQNLEGMISIIDSIKKGFNLILPVNFVKEDTRLSDGISKINELILSKEFLLKNQEKNSPEVKIINQKIEVEVAALKNYLLDEIPIVKKQLNTLIIDQNLRESNLLNLPGIERQLAKLNRDFELTENLYNLYQQKRIEANLGKASTVSKIRVLDPATNDRAILISPKKVQNYQIAFILGLIFPLIIIILKELLSNRIVDFKEIKDKFKSPVIGKLMHSRAQHELPAVEFPWSGITESLRTLHAKIGYILPENDLRVISITSAGSGEGKTFCALNLAAVIALTGKKVLIMGLDLRRPKIHDVFGLSNINGLTNYLVERCEIEDIIESSHIKNLDVICSGPVPPNPVELLSKERMASLMLDLRKKYEIIVFDTPPVGLVADTLILNKYIDINLFIIRIGFTNRNIIQYLKELEDTDSLKRLYIVANDILQPEKYGNGYYNTYYQKEMKKTWSEKIKGKLLK